MSERSVHHFPGEEIDVYWDERLCIHIGECVRAKGELFVSGRTPWCDPDVTERERVREIVERCPSGALSYVDKIGAPEPAPGENAAVVVYNGPLYCHGELALEGVGEVPAQAGTSRRVALCRCGASANKPFCDNSHRAAGFEDFGAVGEQGRGTFAADGPLAVRALPDGPLELAGNLVIRAASARAAWRGDKAYLCRCGASANKPFCDGSHQRVGFKGD
ncbi:hypothetical protein MARPU_09950 [Marichromatium purpuratum 984]|uniref:Iron-binding zinc finger CDGSH type domain-containing protein n=1 Tax=Marichromatium purpuratum 984 TaxID=765910 RepID=W0E0A6_MARPU|nr:CDGSH iron-sulfur domain-containing protein [Marichromatium purpuratum]AHF04137.1 hypothetical protein MARPU_09950 [Marichromatium purpuratum 984]